MKIAIRGFVEGRRFKIFEERLEVAEADLESLIPAMAERHASIMFDRGPHMIEIEFLDELNPAERFLRFGTDPAGMVVPLPWLH
jgi:hypothetical protein